MLGDILELEVFGVKKKQRIQEHNGGVGAQLLTLP